MLMNKLKKNWYYIFLAASRVTHLSPTYGGLGGNVRLTIKGEGKYRAIEQMIFHISHIVHKLFCFVFIYTYCRIFCTSYTTFVFTIKKIFIY